MLSSPSCLDLKHLTLTFELDLDFLLDLQAESSVCMSVCLSKRVVTDRQTHEVKTIILIAVAGCN